MMSAESQKTMQAKVRNYLTTYLRIDEAKMFQIYEPFERDWYKHQERSSKHRLGKLYNATLKQSAANTRSSPKEIQENKRRIARFVDLPRISVFIIEKFENRLIQLFQVPGIEKLWFQPCNYYIDEQLRVTLFYPESTSLFQLLHGDVLNDDHSHSKSRAQSSKTKSLSHILRDESYATKIRIKYQIAF